MNLHILSFDIPYPANYGGVIDVFYKLKTLHQLGVKITLHCFQYGNRKEAKELEQFCEIVYYYPRQTGIKGFSLQHPYIVSSRKSNELLANLLKNNTPILFEGLHTCYYLDHPQLQHRQKWVRMHNIEWEYYQALAESEKSWIKKIYFNVEARLLKRFEAKLQHAQTIFAISPNDCNYLQQRFQNVHYLPAFHSNETLQSQTGKGTYALYHGNLSVNENHEAVMFLVDEVFGQLKYPLIIAGSKPQKELIEAVGNKANVELEIFPSNERLQQLIQDAHINILPTFQATGIKLKLLNALYNGRFCLVNKLMVVNTGLEGLCSIADSAEEFQKQIEVLKERVFLKEDIEARSKVFEGQFSNQENCRRLVDLMSDVSQNL
ncbi:MAG: glycosyltransferase [Chitinophagales bacterium]